MSHGKLETILAAVMALRSKPTLNQLQLAYIAAVLRSVPSRLEAAKILRISIRSLYNKISEMEAAGVNVPRRKDPELLR